MKKPGIHWNSGLSWSGRRDLNPRPLDRSKPKTMECDSFHNTPKWLESSHFQSTAKTVGIRTDGWARQSSCPESCLTDPTITKFLREQNNADEPLFTSRAVKAVL